MKKIAQKVQIPFIVNIANIRNRDAVRLSVMKEWKNFAERENGTRWCREDKTQLVFHKRANNSRTRYIYISFFIFSTNRIISRN